MSSHPIAALSDGFHTPRLENTDFLGQVDQKHDNVGVATLPYISLLRRKITTSELILSQKVYCFRNSSTLQTRGTKAGCVQRGAIGHTK